MARLSFRGTHTALVTPFRNGRVDEEAFARLIRAQIRGGVDGIVPVGTTGESPTLGFEEHVEVIRLAVRLADRKVKVIAGTGGNSTEEAIFLTQAAAEAGADASLQVAPYYNRPSQEGLFQHFRAIARSARLPMVLYNIPGRCGVEIAVETVQRLAAACPGIVGIKEAGGNADRVSQLRGALGREFTILSGDDSLTLPFMAVGAEGVVSVASNVIPRPVTTMVRAFLAGRLAEALRLHARYYPLFKDLFIETNPVPVKTALAMMGWMAEDVRLPLAPLRPASRERLEATLRACGLLRAARAPKA
ncbi:MAG TPA: 4-hydroxy-tetrahydrodipicolinate synthase [Verrucomicrobiota bacterium]|nr:4-hydroxy-tetrahydrodipicolinate synthase [Verrucomicrobiota bacterium]HNU53385.1 4-hydroxy-tetrahydrodipicolinate synthase [Verrucomicrobiota bacterium]